MHTSKFQTLLLLTILALSTGGCFPASNNNAAKDVETTEEVADTRKSAEVMIGKKPAGRNLKQNDAETAYWRDQYKKNRTVPPKEYAVRPSAPKNNNYGEFEEELYASLDMQPSLPGMPGGRDLMPMMGGAPVPPGFYPQQRSNEGGFHSYPPASQSDNRAAAAREGVNNLAKKPRGSMASATAQSLGLANAGLMTEERFYPVEQLVFGGDFPDLDKPENYRLMPKDVISITVLDHPEFSGKLEIQADGTVRVPNLPDLVRLRGLTVDEATEELRQNLQIYVKGECVVRIQANRARGGYYFVLGDVLQPGRFPMGLEQIKLSDAVLAANWETNPGRDKDDDEELGPAFPTANPRGKFIAPRTADLANVQLITPHRSKPVRTTHDVRQAMLGIMREDPIVRPGQIIVVPSLDPRRNWNLGLDMPEAEQVPLADALGRGFSNSSSSARLPDIGAGEEGYGYAAAGAAHAGAYDAPGNRQGNGYGNGQSNNGPIRSELSPDMMDCLTPVQRNMAKAFEIQRTTEVQEPIDEYGDMYYDGSMMGACEPTVTAVPTVSAREWSGKRAPNETADYSAMAPASDNSKNPKTNVAGIAPAPAPEPGPMVEVRTPRGRRLVRPGKAAQPADTETVTEMETLKKGPGKWKMGL